jgi:hypothetical protein
MRLGEQRDHRAPLPFSTRSTSGRWQKLATAARQRPACARRRVAMASSPSSTLSTRWSRS